MGMPSTKKFFPFLLTLVAAGGIAALAAQVYRRPWETGTNLLRARMLLAGAHEGTYEVGGSPIHYYRAGQRGTPIILIHGLGGSAEAWGFLLPRLHKKYTVYALDLPGFGRTPVAPEGIDIRAHVLYLERFLAALGSPRVTLVGNSLGGWIATRFAVEHPERVHQMYLLNSAGLRRAGAQSPSTPDREAARRLIKHVWGHALPVPGFVLDAFVRNSQRPAYHGFIQAYDQQEDVEAALAQVQVPTTIIWGERDQLLPITCAYDFHTGIAHSKLVLLPGVGHTPQIQAAAEIARIILKEADGQQKA
jgi:pimeloyl-ACP methyl ester carboxylesterase